MKRRTAAIGTRGGKSLGFGTTLREDVTAHRRIATFVDNSSCRGHVAGDRLL